MDDKNYMLTIRIPVRGMDDMEARFKSKDVMANIKTMISWDNDRQVKLQEVFENKEPRKVAL